MEPLWHEPRVFAANGAMQEAPLVVYPAGQVALLALPQPAIQNPMLEKKINIEPEKNFFIKSHFLKQAVGVLAGL